MRQRLSDAWWWLRYAFTILLCTSQHVEVRLKAYQRLDALDKENPRLAALSKKEPTDVAL
ncbi:hypothetical protein BAJUN_00990 [Bajunvirus bajun]|uniref:Uncharacterized protein n=1 Tax=Brevundimonas phage vB_BgoS-Bajun TaxID=2948594 RepID=A0A9E7N7D4_9CAUD|nr:hypothetical protein BAJUN_00990 [Brevundimonas phage vB_BgoS-Bajun]